MVISTLNCKMIRETKDLILEYSSLVRPVLPRLGTNLLGYTSRFPAIFVFSMDKGFIYTPLINKIKGSKV
jgi:hypothetical protein